MCMMVRLLVHSSLDGISALRGQLLVYQYCRGVCRHSQGLAFVGRGQMGTSVPDMLHRRVSQLLKSYQALQTDM